MLPSSIFMVGENRFATVARLTGSRAATHANLLTGSANLYA
jgi:hypothetical protein